MDILFELSYLFNQDAQSLGNKDKEYKDLKSIEGQLLEQIPEDLRGKLIDVQTEIAYHNLLNCFLYGLQVGFAALELGQCG
jgi:hypothetical protein